MRFLRYFIIFFLLFTASAQATTYYLDATLGDDSNGGESYDDAWEHASKVDGLSLSAGDKVLFKCGETFSISNDIDIGDSGSSGSPILFAAWHSTGTEGVSGNKPIITWPGTVAGGNSIFSIADDVDYLNFQNLNLVGDGDNDAVDVGIGTSYSGPSNADHIHIDSCDLYGLRHYSIIFFRSSGYTSVTNCTFDTCGNGVYYSNEVDSSTSEYNLIADNTFTDMLASFGYDAHAVGLQSATNTIIRDNTMINCGVPLAYWGNHDASGHSIWYGNTISGYDKYGMVIASTVDDEVVPDTIAYKNTIAKGAGSGYSSAVRLNYAPNDEHYFFHNTFYKDLHGVTIRRGADGVVLRNNIIHTMSGYYIYRVDEGGGYGTPSSLDFDYNDYYDSGTENFHWTSANAGLAAWQSASSLDSNSVVTDLLLVDPENGDFRIPSGSADGGTTLATITTNTGSGTSFVVDTIGYFHNGLGIVDIDGTVEAGQDITLYDATNSYQHETITGVNYGTSTITISASADWIKDTTTVALSYGGTAPDMGYFEYDDPQSEPVVSVVATDATAQEESTTTGTWTIYCAPDCAGETINYSFSGDAVLDTDYDCDDEDGTIDITGASDTIVLTPVDDSAQDVNEVAILTVDAGTGYTVGSPSSANITIEDNDGAQEAGVAGITVDASGSGKVTYDPSGSGSWTR